MPHYYTVRCITPSDGQIYEVRVQAASGIEAESEATAAGHVVQSGGAVADQTPSFDAILVELRGLRSDIQDYKRWVAKRPIIQSPVFTIGWGVIASLLLVLAIAGGVFLATGLFAAASRQP